MDAIKIRLKSLIIIGVSDRHLINYRTIIMRVRNTLYGIVAVFALYYNYRSLFVDFPMRAWYLGLRFLTQWQMLLFNACFAILFVKYNAAKHDHDSNRLLDSLFFMLTGVTSMVGIVFWPIFLYDNTLLVKRGVVIPLDLNVFSHGLLGLICWIDILVHKRSQQGFVLPFAMTAVFQVAYLAFFFAQKHLLGIGYPYPIGERSSWTVFIALTVFIIAGTWLLTALALVLNNLLYAQKPKTWRRKD